MLKSNAEIKKSVASALFSFLFLFCASICGFCGFASSTNGTPSVNSRPHVTFILNENGPLPKTNLPDNAPPPKNSQPEETRSQNIEQEQIFDEDELKELEDELRELENLPPKAAIVLEVAHYKFDNYLNGNCNPQ